MTWQDVVLGIGQFLFTLALLPALRSRAKPPRSTCVLTGGLLVLFAITYASLALWLGALACALCASAWLALAAQRRTPPYAFGWYDYFNDYLYRDPVDAKLARDGGNRVVALYEAEELRR